MLAACVHQPNIVKFRIAAKHRTRKRTQRYYLAMLGARQITYMAHKIQTDLVILPCVINPGMVDNQFINANADKCYFADIASVTPGKKAQPVRRQIIFYIARHCVLSFAKSITQQTGSVNMIVVICQSCQNLCELSCRICATRTIPTRTFWASEPCPPPPRQQRAASTSPVPHDRCRKHN